jgi:ABC-type Mn2+/Zn2+ transport system permease subunit
MHLVVKQPKSISRSTSHDALPAASLGLARSREPRALLLQILLFVVGAVLLVGVAAAALLARRPGPGNAKLAAVLPSAR